MSCDNDQQHTFIELSEGVEYRTNKEVDSDDDPLWGGKLRDPIQIKCLLYNQIGNPNNCEGILQINNVGASDNKHIAGRDFTIGFNKATGRLRFDFTTDG